MQNANHSRNYTGWNAVFQEFLTSAGLDQTLKGFINDMTVMTRNSEMEEVYPALQTLEHNLKELSKNEGDPQILTEESKLKYISPADHATPSTPSQLTREISLFIAKNRAKNNLSNRTEFLRKRRRITTSDGDEASEMTTEIDAPTCARTDAIPINRDAQIKYDIAKNEDGPLARTVKSEQGSKGFHQPTKSGKKVNENENSPKKHSGFLERFSNLEDHLAVRYVPSPPVALLDRIRLLEEHIIRLERNYPPWAALHFKQPNRGWPPPPRATPLIVPTHLTAASNLAPDVLTPGTAPTSEAIPLTNISFRSGSMRQSKKKGSSLHRAVLEKLEVQKALAGED